MPGPSEDVPRWQPPTAPTEDAPPAESAGTVPRWEPDREVPRWQPPTGDAVGARWESGEAPVRRVPVKPRSPLLAPFIWWSRHPWVIVWAGVFLAPGAVLLLRLVDESGFDHLVTPLAGLFVALFALALLRGALASARRS